MRAMPAAMRMLTTRRTRSPPRTIAPRRSAASASTTRRSAASNARSGSGWNTGRSCGGRGSGSNASARGRDRVVLALGVRMNQRLEEAIEQVRALPEERQQEAAQILLAFLDQQNSDVHLTPEQIEEIERRMSDDGPYATDEEVRSVFARLTK